LSWSCGHLFRAALPSHKVNPERASNGTRGAPQRVERDRRNTRIEKPIQLTAAGFHPHCHFALSDSLFAHGCRELLGDDLLDGMIFASFEKPLAGRNSSKVSRLTLAFFRFHYVTSRLRLRASSISECAGF
jgi:hypothetical protein